MFDENGSWELDPDQPLVLLIGSVDTEGVVSALKANGRQYKIKRLESYPENWDTISALFDTCKVRCVLVKLSRESWAHLQNPAYSAARDRLFSRVGQVPHAVFVFEDNFATVSPDDVDWTPESSWYENGEGPKRKAVNKLLGDWDLHLIPFRRSAEVTVLATAFIEEVEAGLIFRVYVPAGRLWAEQTDKLLQLFRDYLSRTGHAAVRLDQKRTEHGVIYEFFQAPDSPSAAEPKFLASAFADFSHLLDLTLTDPAAAEELLRAHDVDPTTIVALLTRYSKEARRLQIDIRQEREQRMLAIRHRLESELADALPPGASMSTLLQLADQSVPSLAVMSDLVSKSPQPLRITAGAGGSVTINMQPQFVEAINSIVAQEIQGDVHLSAEDQQLLALLEEHGGERRAELSSAVRELADDSAPTPQRFSAKQRLKSFVFQLGNKVPEFAANVLVAYLDRRFNGGP